MPDRRFSFQMRALDAAMAAKAGRLTLRDRLDLAMAALAPDIDQPTRETIAGFLTACREARDHEAGEVLHNWLLATLPAQALAPAAGVEFDWQRRKDIV